MTIILITFLTIGVALIIMNIFNYLDDRYFRNKIAESKKSKYDDSDEDEEDDEDDEDEYIRNQLSKLFNKFVGVEMGVEISTYREQFGDENLKGITEWSFDGDFYKIYNFKFYDLEFEDEDYEDIYPEVFLYTKNEVVMFKEIVDMPDEYNI